MYRTILSTRKSHAFKVTRQVERGGHPEQWYMCKRIVLYRFVERSIGTENNELILHYIVHRLCAHAQAHTTRPKSLLCVPLFIASQWNKRKYYIPNVALCGRRYCDMHWRSAYTQRPIKVSWTRQAGKIDREIRTHTTIRWLTFSWQFFLSFFRIHFGQRNNQC